MDGLVFYAKARAFKAKATNSRLRPRNLALRPTPRINIPGGWLWGVSSPAD